MRCTWLNAGRHDRCCVNFAWFSYRSRSPGLVDHSNFAGDVGRAQLQEYFGRLRQLLRPGGLMLNHGITAGGLHNHQLGSGMGALLKSTSFLAASWLTSAMSSRSTRRRVVSTNLTSPSIKPTPGDVRIFSLKNKGAPHWEHLGRHGGRHFDRLSGLSSDLKGAKTRLMVENLSCDHQFVGTGLFDEPLQTLTHLLRIADH